MYKLARSRPLVAALKAVKVRTDAVFSGMGIDNQQQDTPARSSALQQKRFLSIHEYLSANLLKTVGMFPGYLRR